MMRHTLLAFLVLLGSASLARAGLVVSLLNETPGAPDSTYEYSVTLQSGEQLSPTANTSATPAGNFFTIYDIPGFVSASTLSSWNTTSQLTGVTPEGLTPVDSASLINVTYTWTGTSTVSSGSSSLLLGDINIVSTSSNTRTGQFSSQDSTSAGIVETLANLTVPALLPEPASIGIIGMAMLILGRRRAASQ
jgi:hypothetical protein